MHDVAGRNAAAPALLAKVARSFKHRELATILTAGAAALLPGRTPCKEVFNPHVAARGG